MRLNNATEWMKDHANNDNRVESINEAVKLFNIRPENARRAYVMAIKNKDNFTKSSFQNGINEEELRSRHDPIFKVRKAAELLLEGRFIQREKFRNEIVRISPVNFKEAEREPEFSKYQGRSMSGGIIYWSHPSSIKKMIQDHVLQEVQ
jgi:hypothetical protein